MSETTTNTEDLNEQVELEVDDAEVITVPIDDTLSNSGEAADAKAVGDALALKANKSELPIAVKVNGQAADAQGLIIVTAAQTAMSGTDDTTIQEAIQAVDGKTAEDIPVSGGTGAQTIAQALSSGATRAADQIDMSASDHTKVKTHIDQLETDVDALEETVAGLDEKDASQIKWAAGAAQTVKAHVDSVEAAAVRSVYGVTPDSDGDVAPERVPYADNLWSDDMDQVDDEFMIRTTGGELSVDSGYAWLLRLMGNRVHTGFVQESLSCQAIAIPRPTPDAITATLDEETFEAYVGEAGTYTLTYTDSWSASPTLYGVTVSNTPISGDKIVITWDGENDAEITVDAAERQAPPQITVAIDRDTFVAYVDSNLTKVLLYTTAWSEDPALYGVTVTNTPVSGDQIKIVYVKEVRGTIAVAAPTAFTATGWNLYDHTNGYARVVKYDDVHGYVISGTYTGIAYAEDPEDEDPTPITPDADGKFNVTGTGYIIVTGGNNTDTAIWPEWSDWGEGYSGSWAAYSESTVSLAAVMTARFPNGLLRVGDVRDEIDLNEQAAVSRVERLSYSAENRAAAAATGRAYEFDENYIYLERATPVTSEITLDGRYSCDDHGMEWFAGGTVAPYAETLYGANLKDRLRRDVITRYMTVSQVKGL